MPEAYPELTADESFLRLQRELADTESRVAGTVAPSDNDTLTLLRNRAQAVPASLVVRFLALGSRSLTPADGFERTVPAPSARSRDPSRAGGDAGGGDGVRLHRPWSRRNGG